MDVPTAYKNTIGLKISFEIETEQDLVYMENAKILYKKQNGEKGFWDAQYEGNSIFRITEKADLDQTGNYKLQPYVEFKDGLKFFGDIVDFYVKETLVQETLL